MSLLTNRRADDEDVLPQDNKDKQGWVGDEILNDLYPEELILGSKLWLLQRSKINDTLLSNIKEYTLEALQWLITFKVAERVLVEVTRENMSHVSMEIIIYRPTDDKLSYKYFYNWEAQLLVEPGNNIHCKQHVYEEIAVP